MSAEFKSNNLHSASATPLPEGTDTDDLMWDLLSLYMDGEASPEEAAQVEQMLRHDAEYARAYEFMQQTSGAVRAIVEVEPPAFLRDAILAKTSHRVTFVQRLSAGIAALRLQWALPSIGRWAFAGGSLAACALLVGMFTARPANDGTVRSGNSPVVAAVGQGTLPIVPNVTVPVIPPIPNVHREAIAASDNSSAAKVGAKVANATPAHNMKIDTSNLRPEPAIVLPGGVRSEKAKLVASTHITGGAVTIKPSKNNTIAVGKPQRKSLQLPRIPDSGSSDNNVDTQNVSPMMDASVQHRQIAMMPVDWRTDDDLGHDVVTSTDDSNTAPATTVASADTDSAPKNRIVGKLQLSKLPPTARHIQTAADIQRIQEARNLGYTATVMESMQRREADVPVFSGKF